MTRGKVYKRQGVWHAIAIHAGEVVWADNSGPGTQPMMLNDCTKIVTAFQVVGSKGHHPHKTWAQIVEEAGKHL